MTEFFSVTLRPKDEQEASYDFKDVFIALNFAARQGQRAIVKNPDGDVVAKFDKSYKGIPHVAVEPVKGVEPLGKRLQREATEKGSGAKTRSQQLAKKPIAKKKTLSKVRKIKR